MLTDRLTHDMKEAMKARDTLRLSTLRLTLSEIKNARIEKGDDLTDEEVTRLIKTAVKRREEAAEQFAKGNRDDMAKQETEEGEILKAYLPPQLGDTELGQAVDAAIQEANAKSIKDMGQVMKLVMAAHPGGVDGKAVQKLVRERLGEG